MSGEARPVGLGELARKRAMHAQFQRPPVHRKCSEGAQSRRDARTRAAAQQPAHTHEYLALSNGPCWTSGGFVGSRVGLSCRWRWWRRRRGNGWLARGSMQLNLYGYGKGQAACEHAAVALLRNETSLSLALLLTTDPFDTRFGSVGDPRDTDAQSLLRGVRCERIVAKLSGQACSHLGRAMALE